MAQAESVRTLHDAQSRLQGACQTIAALAERMTRRRAETAYLAENASALMPAVAARTLTFKPDEYEAWEDGQLERHEYHFGEVYAMSGGTFSHARLSAALTAALIIALRDSDCLVLSEAMRVEVLPDLQFVYPDVTVICGQPAFRTAAQTTLQNPTVVCEVLSPATARYDRGEKFALYRGVPSVQAVVYVDPDARTVELRHRTASTWAVAQPVSEGEVRIESLGISLAVDALFGSGR